jgi:hypothetical protein
MTASSATLPSLPLAMSRLFFFIFMTQGVYSFPEFEVEVVMLHGQIGEPCTILPVVSPCLALKLPHKLTPLQLFQSTISGPIPERNIHRDSKSEPTPALYSHSRHLFPGFLLATPPAQAPLFLTSIYIKYITFRLHLLVQTNRIN